MDKRRNHIIFWVIFPIYYGGLTFIALKDKLPFHNILSRIFLGCSITCAIFYILTLFLFPKFIVHKKYVLFILGILLLLIGAALWHKFVLFILNQFYPQLFSLDSITVSFTKIVFPTIRAVYLAFPYWLIKRLSGEIYQKNYLQAESFLIKKIAIDSELMSLKNQINPHFLYNTLNFLYAQSLPFSSNLSNSILTLSEMMRYALNESNHLNKVSLQQEIDYVKKYIQLENMHQIPKRVTKFDVEGNTNFKRIFPMTFQPILENALRFGEDINLQIKIEESRICLTSFYTLKNNIKEIEVDNHFEDLKQKIIKTYKYHCTFNITFEKQMYKLSVLFNL
jgi:two-component system, LytTR family, sensor kinase